jgi:flavin reductase (DIM6/NTAB) family NADH-FMN oxidoreductase RutF
MRFGNNTMRSFDPDTIPYNEIHRLLVGGVAPRPIALVSSLDKEGKSNLSPFSFFNVFGVNPAVLCFSPAYSGKTGKPKHTMLNLLETRECTVSIVTYEMVHQISLASAPYDRGVDEFVKSGLTKLPSVKVKAPGVAESPFVMEAKLLHHIDFGKTHGSANLMICEVVMLHVSEKVLTEHGSVDPILIDQVARLGGPYYTRAKRGIFALPQPGAPLAGIDLLPEEIRSSPILTGKQLAQLASLEELPTDVQEDDATITERHTSAQSLLEKGDVLAAWRALAGK